MPTELQRIETAMCLWEAFLVGSEIEDINKLQARVGAADLRLQFANTEILDACHKGWEIAQENGFDEPFDWEFCPSFLQRAITVAGNHLVLCDEWETVCRQIGEQANAA